VGTLATITALDTPQPGLMLIRSARASSAFASLSQRSQLKHGLWIADVSADGRRHGGRHPRGSAEHAAALWPSCQTCSCAPSRVAEHAATAEVQGAWRYDDCGWVANRWCELLPLPAADSSSG
jgi:hypothetical protein